MSGPYELVEKLQEIEPWPGKIRNGANDVANSWLAKHLHLDGAIREGGNGVADKTQELVDKTKPVVQDAKDIQKLQNVPAGWDAIIRKLSGEIVAEFGKPEMGLRGHWEGSGAEAYTAMSEQQQHAMEKLLAMAKKAKQTIDDMNDSAETFFYGVMGFVVGALVALAAALISLAGVVTAVPGWAVCLTAIIAAIGGLASLITTFGMRCNDLAKGIRSLKDESNDQQFFPGPPAGRWPAVNNGAYSLDQGWEAK
ncbi:hypothetical protein [Mycobacteroides saopaulense]|uniref:hypothetical protein n=1 Tax=Mycobacteroides saopaulense TaxID=1578165 RepID=UPI001041F05C|nr:hypothetical protein [Mycobacteroides saopaulense]